MLVVQLLSISLLDIYHVTKAFQQTIKGSLSKHKYKNNTLYILSLSVRNIFCFVLLILELVLYVYVVSNDIIMWCLRKLWLCSKTQNLISHNFLRVQIPSNLSNILKYIYSPYSGKTNINFLNVIHTMLIKILTDHKHLLQISIDLSSTKNNEMGCLRKRLSFM